MNVKPIKLETNGLINGKKNTKKHNESYQQTTANKQQAPDVEHVLKNASSLNVFTGANLHHNL